VEHAVRSTQLMDHVVVLMTRTALGQPRMCAYVACPQWDKRLKSDLKKRFARSMPGGMGPSRLVALDDLPATPLGKIDRRALPKELT
jgi:non-ribosomal peptide synthetase component E (peptide arylation enzyme)